MLQFDKDTIQFTYIQKSHLKSSLNITNPNDQFVFYKFKITQPKYYLIKQQKATIKPKSTVVIDITLHKDGIPTAGYDKIKCYYIATDHQLTHQPQNFERRSDTQTHKFTIKVNGLPLGLQKLPTQMKQSSVSYFLTQIRLNQYIAPKLILEKHQKILTPQAYRNKSNKRRNKLYLIFHNNVGKDKKLNVYYPLNYAKDRSDTQALTFKCIGHMGSHGVAYWSCGGCAVVVILLMFISIYA